MMVTEASEAYSQARGESQERARKQANEWGTHFLESVERGTIHETKSKQTRGTHELDTGYRNKRKSGASEGYSRTRNLRGRAK